MTTVRSVAAHLSADVDGYIRDMRRAGRETDKAFTSMVAAQRGYNREVGVADSRTQKLTQSTRALRSEVSGVRDDFGKLGLVAVRARDGLDRVGVGARSSRAEIDDLSGRLRIGLDLLAMFGPAASPITALAVPAVAGLSAQLAAAGAAGVTTILAFQGVGEALGAIEKARLEPTTANLFAAEQALSRLTPQAREFAAELGAMRPQIAAATVDAAAEGLFPGLTRSLDDLESLLPRADRFFSEIGEVTGDLTADAAESLASPRWTEFFDYLQSEARPTLTDLYSTVGDLTHGLGNLMMATDPLADDFSSWLAGAASDFDAWSASLAQSDGFVEFVDYVRENGPRVAETARAIGGALIDIGVAAAPLGGPSLAALEAVAKVITTIADSPLGTPLLGLAAGMAALNRTMAVSSRLQAGGFFAGTRGHIDKLSSGVKGLAGDFGALAVAQGGAHRAGRGVRADMDAAATRATNARDRISSYGAAAGKAALGVGALAVASTEMGESFGIQNTATLGLAGSMLSKWGGAAGAAVGAVLDLRAANQDLETSFGALRTAQQRGSVVDEIANFASARDGLRQQEDLVDQFWDLSRQWELLSSGNLWEATQAALGDLVGYGVRDAREELAAYNQEAAEAANTGDLGNLLAAPFDRAAGSIAGATAATVDFTAATGRLERFLSGQAALIDYESALDDVSEALARNGNNFDYNSRAGQENGRAMIALGQSAIEYAKTLEGPERRTFLRDVRRDLRGLQDEFPAADRIVRNITRELDSLKPAKIQVDSSGVRLAEGQARQLREVYDTFPEDLRTRIETTGVPSSKTEVKALQRAYDLTPAQVRTLMTLQAAGAKLGIRDVLQLLGQADGTRANPKVDVNARAAEAAIAGVRAGLASIDGRNTSSSHTHTTFYKQVGRAAAGAAGLGASLLGNAEGGYYDSVRFYAGGGGYQPRRDPGDRANGHAPQIARPGRVWRVWGEEETEGEVYAPLADDYRRPRAKQIIEQTVDHFGGQVEWYAEGGVRSGRRRDADDRARDARERAREAKEKAREAREDAREKARERRQNIRQAARDFNPDRGDNVWQVSKALRILERDVRRAGGAWTKTMDRHSDQMVAATVRYNKLSKALEDNRDDLRELRQDAASYRADIRSSFNNNIFGNGLAGLGTQLEADRNDTSAMDAALDQAVRRGLSGGLEKALRASGDLTTAEQLSKLSRADIARYERLYNERATAQNRYAADSSDRVFGASIRAHERLVAKQTRALEQIDRNLNRWEKSIRRDVRDGVEQGAARGFRAVMNDRNAKATITAKTRRR